MKKRQNKLNLGLGFNKTDLVEKELIDKVTLWVLKIILDLGGYRTFMNKDNYFSSNDKLAYFLDLDKYVEMDESEYTRSTPLKLLKDKLIKLEKQKKFTTSKILSKNIQQISSLMQLNKQEEKILEFVVLVKQYDVLNEAVELLGNDLNSSQVKRVLSVILDISKRKIDRAFASNSKLSKASLVVINKQNTNSLDMKLDSLSDVFIDNMLSLDENISVMIKDSVHPCGKSDLKIKDYAHISKDINILLPYLENAIVSKQKGVNILLYGLPGTGKTELAKVLASYLKIKLFEVSYIDENDEPIDGSKRLKAYKIAQSLLTNKKTLLMYDESEDIFESNSGLFAPKRQKDKAWINRVLETNMIPTIWITNDIDSIDNAQVRRFDMSIELPIPSKTIREEIIKNYSKNFLDKKTIKILAKNENIAPALISTTAKVIGSIKGENSTKPFTHLLNNTLRAQGYEEMKKDTTTALPESYNSSYINTDINLKELAKGIKKHPNARICLYGVPGTGKSAFGKWIAEYTDKPFVLKTGSDLISKWVGETEKNIAAAFEEAKEEGAVLVFDEVDSFLQDRRDAKNSWEVTKVNEMLVQMENFNGVFIATTNLMSGLDQASIRRFDMKLEFGYLKTKHAWKLFKKECKVLGIDIINKDLCKEKMGALDKLTPGDFASVRRQDKFRPVGTTKDFIARLKDEVAAKNVDNERKVGFFSS